MQLYKRETMLSLYRDGKGSKTFVSKSQNTVCGVLHFNSCNMCTQKAGYTKKQAEGRARREITGGNKPLTSFFLNCIYLTYSTV